MLTVVENLRKFELNSMPNDKVTVKTFECPKCENIIEFKYASPMKCQHCNEKTSFVDRLLKGLYDRMKYYKGDQTNGKYFESTEAWYD